MKNWTSPILAIPSYLWEDKRLGCGFLTPTPFRLPNGNIRVFGGVRDQRGRSSIYWADLNSKTSKVVAFAEHPCFDTRDSADFDTDGAILGDIFSYKEGLGMFYVGFKQYEDVKFRAFTGFAFSTDFGASWEKRESPINELQRNVGAGEIFAVHNVRILEDKVEMLLAIGDGWEILNHKRFPRYRCFGAAGSSFEDLVISTEVLLPQSQDLYRLGRPRYLTDSKDKTQYIVATGGKRNGDYRPYIFEKSNETWVISGIEFPVLPGHSAEFSQQVSYPASITVDDSLWVFINGDDMGRSGSYLIRGNVETIATSDR